MIDIMNIILEKGGYDNCTAEEKTAADDYAYAQVRKRRDKLLGWTDKYATPDFAHKTEDLKAVAARAMLNRVGEPEDIARVVAFLASEQASFMTGKYNHKMDIYIWQTHLEPVTINTNL